MQETRLDMPNIYRMETPDMPDTTTYEERQQARQLLNQYLGLVANKTFFLSLLVAMLMIIYVSLENHPLEIYFLLAGLVVSLYTVRVARLLRREFIGQMTAQELDLIARTPNEAINKEEKKAAKNLIKAYQKVNPEWEYLRPSHKTQDETLLRAAAYTETTPQDQLLRPSNPNDATL